MTGVRLVLRLLIGVLVLGAGVGKALDVPGFLAVVDTYRLLPSWALAPTGLFVIVVELGLGVWLLGGWRLAPAALGSVAVHLGYGVLLAVTLGRGLALSNCGCFGIFLARPLRWYSPLEDLAVAGLSWSLYRLARRPDAERRVVRRNHRERRSRALESRYP